MAATRAHLEKRDLLDVARAAFNGRDLVSAQRLRGGSKKGVYRLILDDGTTSIAYVWSTDENYWPHERDGAFGDAGGLDLFAMANTALGGIGARVPRVIMLDDTLIAGEVAVVEDIRGGSLEALCKRDPQRADRVLARLGETVTAMHRHQAPGYGRPGTEPSTNDVPAHDIVLNRALDHLVRSASRVDRIAAVEQRLADTLRQRHTAVAPRTQYGLIHGELGPDHVLIDDQDEPVLIDIEGAMFFDSEWEHAFLQLRFRDTYRHLHADNLDNDRLNLYRLALYLSLVAGPLQLLDGDFPHRAAMQDIVEQNIGRTLAELA